MHAANGEVVAVGSKVLANLCLVLPLVRDLDAEQDLEAVTKLLAQCLYRLHSLLMGGQGGPHLAWVEVEVVR